MAEKYWEDLTEVEKNGYNKLSYDTSISQFFSIGVFVLKGKPHNKESYTKNVLFNTPINLDSINASQGLKFENCYFSEDVQISRASGKL